MIELNLKPEGFLENWNNDEIKQNLNEWLN
jgi:hypothetical protein